MVPKDKLYHEPGSWGWWNQKIEITITVHGPDGEPHTSDIVMTREQYHRLITEYPEVVDARQRQQERFADWTRSLPKLDTMSRKPPKRNYFHDFMLIELRQHLGTSIPVRLQEDGSLLVDYADAEGVEWVGYVERANTPALARLWEAHRIGKRKAARLWASSRES